jgi:hypothetical protein
VRIGVTGHQDLPESTLPAITRAVRAQLEAAVDITGVSSLAAGADQLFCSVVLDLGGELEVIVPSDHYESTLSGSSLLLYHRLLAEAKDVRRLAYARPSEEAFLAAGKEVVERCDLILAIWDGQPAAGLGGTADIVRYARQRGVPVQVIWPE